MAKCELLKWYVSKAFQCLSNIPFFIHSEYFIINKKQLTYYTCHYDIKIHALKTTSSSQEEESQNSSTNFHPLKTRKRNP